MKNSLLALCIVFAACGTQSSGKEKPLTPDTYAEEVYVIWEQAIISLNNIIGNNPPVSEELIEKVKDLKEETISKLIVYGEKHSQMTEELKTSSSNKLVMKMGKMASLPAWDNVMNQCFKHYFNIDYKFSNIISSFNTITQYADYDLLKKQLPAEAERLGIK